MGETRFPDLYYDGGTPYCWHYLAGGPGARYWRNLTDADFRAIASPTKSQGLRTRCRERTNDRRKP